MREEEFVRALRDIGARVFRVGGCVRDHFRGAQAKDVDYAVTGIAEERFHALFPHAEKIGKAFPVYHVRVDGVRREVAFARRERKTGAGYRGFDVAFDPTVTIEEDLYRRDTRMNAMALELPSGALLDPYGGRANLAAGVICAVSEHFTDDPVRALRAARQAAEFGYRVEEGTLLYMRACADELRREPTERLMAELRRALAAPRPSVFFRVLRAADLLAVTFPEIAALEGQVQPVEFHPEGDALAHTLAMVDAVAEETEDIRTRFAALVHDLGKSLTPKEMLPHHYGHEKTGLTALAAWNRRMTLPHDWMKAASFVIRQHMRAPRLTRLGKIVDLLLGVGASGLSMAAFNIIIRADHGSLPPYLAHGAAALRTMQTITGRSAPTDLAGAEIGIWLREQRVRILKKFLLENEKAWYNTSEQNEQNTKEAE
ncbi:tRNA adenylyltransferase [Selenomonas sp. oral taxon 126]|uniref:HD domain-containing protein n=1 Tax=Selenomonas sp. oral taxon 126 TaxID=712528 RepID=UPI0008077C41|nr:HD domain-containing protein [Selenomonas sp. oral taxon 126]ANR70619.1 tRNA adenylyltransferase [Selenomonas sp. oral taxon 126]